MAARVFRVFMRFGGKSGKRGPRDRNVGGQSDRMDGRRLLFVGGRVLLRARRSVKVAEG